MSVVINTIVNGAVEVVGSGLNGALSGLGVSMTTVAALYGEQHEFQLVQDLKKLQLEGLISLNELELRLAELELSLKIKIGNVELEAIELNLALSIPNLRSISPPTFEFILNMDKLRNYIALFFGIVIIAIILDANFIKASTYRYKASNNKRLNHVFLF